MALVRDTDSGEALVDLAILVVLAALDAVLGVLLDGRAASALPCVPEVRDLSVRAELHGERQAVGRGLLRPLRLHDACGREVAPDFAPEVVPEVVPCAVHVPLLFLSTR